MKPRVVVVVRQDELQSLRATYGTFQNASYALSSRGGSIEQAQTRSVMYTTAVGRVEVAIPEDWRKAKVTRDQLDRFLFEPNDIIAVVGQDGLVANVAKYLKDKQLVIGFNDNKEKNPGVLVKHEPFMAPNIFDALGEKRELPIEKRTMVKVTLDDGQELTALNEIFIGHRGHQSARYSITTSERTRTGYPVEHQSSSGVIVSTGTGYTGWCSSIMRQCGFEVGNPLDEGYITPEEKRLVFMVREPWVSPATGNKVDWGFINQNETLVIRSEMEEGGVIFGDGIEIDHLFFDYGRVATVTVADNYLRLL